MKFKVPCIIHEEPTKSEWVSLYPDNRMLAKLTYLAALKVYQRVRLAEAQNWKCCWCGGLTIPEANHKRSATIEHIIPKSEGGSDSWDNLAMSCAPCNHNRRNLSVEEYSAIKRGEGARIKPTKKEAFQERRLKRRTGKDTVLALVLDGSANPYPEDSKEGKMFLRYKTAFG